MSNDGYRKLLTETQNRVIAVWSKQTQKDRISAVESYSDILVLKIIIVLVIVIKISLES